MIFRRARLGPLLLLSASFAWMSVAAAAPVVLPETAEQRVAVMWRDDPGEARVEVRHGELVKVSHEEGSTRVQGPTFAGGGTGAARMVLHVRGTNTAPGGDATLVTIHHQETGFSFFLRDVTAEHPVFLPDLGIVVSTPDDRRSYDAVARQILARGGLTKLQAFEQQPEAGFDGVSATTRQQTAPTWLGLSRDVRLFKILPSGAGTGREHDVIQATLASTPVTLPETKSGPAVYGYTAGRGQGVAVRVTRQLEDGALPILHKVTVDDDVRYHTTTFVAPEVSPLRHDTLHGTHYLIADSLSSGSSLTAEQSQRAATLRAQWHPAEEVVLHLRVEARNTGDVPRYAFFRAPKPGWVWADRHEYDYDVSTGFSSYAPDRVFCVSLLDGRPLPQEEVAVLLPPGQSVVFDCRLPHQPVNRERAGALGAQHYVERHDNVRAFWLAKLAAVGQIHVPEPRVHEMLRAGLLHLDLVTYGEEPAGALAAAIGIYPPIGTESAPIVQYYDSLGRHDVARRCLEYFLEKQRPDGLIQNFADYMIETGAVLWSIGEHVRYTADHDWIAEVKEAVLRSCDFLLAWRARNRTDTLRGASYGLIEGKVADPNDPYHQFMLNAYGHLGLSRVAEALRRVDPARSAALAREAAAWRQDIRVALEQAMIRSPVVPFGDGRWGRTAPPWTETTGPRALYATGEKQFTHGSFAIADSLLGPMHLVFGEVLDPDEPLARELLEYHSELFYADNAAFSQPYYSRHDWVQLRRGLVKPFLQTWYSTFSALADRETYTFWEHLYQVSEHKTHEEAWFLMQTRWMLYLEDHLVLRLLAGIPRAWLSDGQSIVLDQVASYFGPLSLSVHSQVGAGTIEARVSCPGKRRPGAVALRLPHPNGRRPVAVHGGTYHAESETVHIADFGGEAHVRLEFAP